MTERPGQSERCPHCGAYSGVAPDGEGGHRCLLCGAPRVLVTEAIERPGAERPWLEGVKTQRARRAAWVIASSVIGAFGALSFLIALGVFFLVDLGAFATMALFAVALAPLLVTLFGFRAAKAASRTASEQFEEARQVVANELVAARGGAGQPRDIARLMGISEDRAIELVAHAEVAGLTAPEISAPRYRVESSQEMEDLEPPAADTGRKVVR